MSTGWAKEDKHCIQGMSWIQGESKLVQGEPKRTNTAYRVSRNEYRVRQKGQRRQTLHTGESNEYRVSLRGQRRRTQYTVQGMSWIQGESKLVQGEPKRTKKITTSYRGCHEYRVSQNEYRVSQNEYRVSQNEYRVCQNNVYRVTKTAYRGCHEYRVSQNYVLPRICVRY